MNANSARSSDLGRSGIAGRSVDSACSVNRVVHGALLSSGILGLGELS